MIVARNYREKRGRNLLVGKLVSSRKDKRSSASSKRGRNLLINAYSNSDCKK